MTKKITESRNKKTLINIISVIVSQIMSFVYALLSKKLFLDIFSISAFGVIDLFSSFFYSLMLLEMGFGTILIYNLYKPIALKDEIEINRQLSIFKTIYSLICIIIVFISVIISPFLFDIFNIDFADKLAVYVIYFSNVFTVIVKYSFLNKISLVNADGNKYIEVFINIFVEFLSFIVRLASLLLFKNIYIYLFAQLLLPSLTYIIENEWIVRNYNIKKIKFASFKEIIDSGVLKQCRKYIYTTIYELTFFSMDNIIISIALSTDSISYVSNYIGLINTASYLIVMVLNSFRGVIANFYHESKNDQGLYEVFDVYSNFNFIFTSIISVGMYTMIDNFISIWIGNQYLIDTNIKFILIFTLAMNGIFESINNVFTIKGYIFKEKWFLISSALTNFILTIILIKPFGLFGAYLGTLIAQLVRWVGKVYFVTDGVFVSQKNKIIIKYLIYIIFISVEMLVMPNIISLVFVEQGGICVFVIECVFIIFIVVLINGAFVYNNKNFKLYFINNIKKRF